LGLWGGPVRRRSRNTIEHAWPALLFAVGLDRCARPPIMAAQVRPPFAAAAGERDHDRAQTDDGTSRRSRAVVANFRKSPMRLAPYKDFPVSGEASQAEIASEF